MKELYNTAIDEIADMPGCWSGTGPYYDVVISTNAGLARNVANISFPRKQDEFEADYVTMLAGKFAAGSLPGDKPVFISLHGATHSAKRLLRERNIIPDENSVNDGCSIIAAPGAGCSIVVNNGDHFNINACMPGLQPAEAYSKADSIDNELNRFARYAFSESLGYITADPFRMGAALTVSASMHLPVTSLSKKIYEVFESAVKNGMALEGMTGEGKKSNGCIYRLSTRATIGVTEDAIVGLLWDTAKKIIDIEYTEREHFLAENGKRLEDRIFRSYGILRYARSIDCGEAMSCLSDIRLGIILSYIKNWDVCGINDLMINCQQSHLQKISNIIFTDNPECDSFRASYLRERFRESING